MMNLFPYKNITYTSKLSGNEIINKLHQSNQYETFGNGYFGNTFNIKPIINYRNSFLPMIKGNISENTRETIVKVIMRPHTIVLTFMAFWLAIILIGCILTFYAMITNGGNSSSFLFLFILFLFGTILPCYTFRHEFKKQKKIAGNF